MKLHNIKLLRQLFLPLFSKINPGNITINHHWTGERLLLHSFKHKGYWFYGKNRERKTMELAAKLIRENDTIVEIGGHIGYLSLYFSSLVKGGKVYVFEPAYNNLPYLKENLKTKENVVVIEKGVGSCNTHLPFYVENLTGQNNSFIINFPGYQKNKENAFYQEKNDVDEILVEVVKLDDFVEQMNIVPNFIKVDVEGFEFEVIKGMLCTLENFHPILMIEVQDNFEPIYQMMKKYGYKMLDENLNIINSHERLWMNTFFLHQDAHYKILNNLNIPS
ncbi:MAG TPA: hypothetical protein DCY88_28710 [Cyanobacteria bacterium UBA11372]|nr:hypothetical protein [Cyanobacteria bacterium UBA11372]